MNLFSLGRVLTSLCTVYQFYFILLLITNDFVFEAAVVVD